MCCSVLLQCVLQSAVAVCVAVNDMALFLTKTRVEARCVLHVVLQCAVAVCCCVVLQRVLQCALQCAVAVRVAARALTCIFPKQPSGQEVMCMVACCCDACCTVRCSKSADIHSFRCNSRVETQREGGLAK